ncbi:DUF1376 domain-containing protein [Terasakiella sp.]|uniref:DUF1376 domain-containing protein n=1 Tax=Terasakiella sp. TaxID=2034861 RepID=UPI003AA907EC
MSGLSRVDFYPRDWLADTRGLSHAAKGCYIDILSVIYNQGEAIPYDEDYLCQLLGFKQIRSMRKVVQELFDTEKLQIIDGKIVNNRALEEIEKANFNIENGRKGGKKQQKNTKKTSKNVQKNGNLSDVSEGGNEEKQSLNTKPPSPSPSPMVNGSGKPPPLARDKTQNEISNLQDEVMQIVQPIANDKLRTAFIRGDQSQLAIVPSWLQAGPSPAQIIEVIRFEVEKLSSQGKAVSSLNYFQNPIERITQNGPNPSASPTSQGKGLLGHLADYEENRKLRMGE